MNKLFSICLLGALWSLTLLSSPESEVIKRNGAYAAAAYDILVKGRRARRIERVVDIVFTSHTGRNGYYEEGCRKFELFKHVFLSHVQITNSSSSPIRLRYSAVDKYTASLTRKKVIISEGETMLLNDLLSKQCTWRTVKNCPGACAKQKSHRHCGSRVRISSENLESGNIEICE